MKTATIQHTIGLLYHIPYCSIHLIPILYQKHTKQFNCSYNVHDAASVLKRENLNDYASRHAQKICAQVFMSLYNAVCVYTAGTV